MDKADLISIIVPVYNVEEYLPRCLDSILKQSYSKLEIIIVDDGSTDRSSYICDEYMRKDSRIKVIHQQNAGVSVARNTALSIINGYYVAFVDSDDWIHPNYIEKMFVAIKKYNAELVCCAYKKVEYFDDFQFQNEYQDEIETKLIIVNSTNNYLPGHGSACCKLFQKNIINDFNLSFPNGIRYAEDYIFGCQYMMHCKCIVDMNQILYYYFQRSTSATHTFDILYYKYAIQRTEWAINLYNSIQQMPQTSKNLILVTEVVNNITAIFNYYSSAVSAKKTIAVMKKTYDAFKPYFLSEPQRNFPVWLNKFIKIYSRELKTGDIKLMYWHMKTRKLISSFLRNKKILIFK